LIFSMSARCPRACGASTASSPRRTAAAFLTDHFPLAQKSIWDISGMFTHSRHVPVSAFAGSSIPV
jgi:hypothetical protein